MTEDQFNEKVIQGLENLITYVNSAEFEALVLAGPALVLNEESATAPTTWTNALQLNIYRKLGLDTGVLATVTEEPDGFTTSFPEGQPAHVDRVVQQMLSNVTDALRGQTFCACHAGATQAQQLQGVRSHVRALLVQARLHLAGAHAPRTQH